VLKALDRAGAHKRAPTRSAVVGQRMAKPVDGTLRRAVPTTAKA
jgi:hypothetical protein